MDSADQNNFSTSGLAHYFKQLESSNEVDIEANLDEFCELDDHDVWAAIKDWRKSNDKILAYLSQAFINRKLFKIILSSKPIVQKQEIIDKLSTGSSLSGEELANFYSEGSISNAAYIRTGQKIKMLRKSGEVIDIEDATDLPNINAMSQIVSKHYFCWFNQLDI